MENRRGVNKANKKTTTTSDDIRESIFFDESLQFLSFNQDGGCFAVGTDSGFRIFNSDPFKETFRRDFDGGAPTCRELRDAR